MGSEGERPRVLVVDDERHLRELLTRAFSADFDVLCAQDGNQALSLARHQPPEVVISDQRMPGLSGVELLERIREEFPDSVRILVTAYADYGALVDAVNAGGIHHYLEKPFHVVQLQIMVESLLRERRLEAENRRLVSELIATVKRLEEVNKQLLAHESDLSREVEARTRELADANARLARFNDELREAVVRDPLTGLFNRLYLQEYLNIELARATRYARSVSLLFLDLDGFKQVNDTLGHQVGDAVLKRVGELLAANDQRLRKSDLAARYGGEEFVLVLPETNHSGAVIKASRICELFAGHDWHQVHPALTRMTVSIGVSTFPDDGPTAAELVQAADDRLYTAKRGGKNRAVGLEAVARA
jgi:diguanylate cyclase (GGDEF)-like protein